MRNPGLACLFLAALVHIALIHIDSVAQSESPPNILTSKGAATVRTPPETVEFRLHKTSSGESLLAAAQPLLTLEDDLKMALKDRELTVLSLDVSGIVIPAIAENRAEIHAGLILPLDRFGSAEERVKAAAEQYTAVREIATSLGCGMVEPVLGVEDVESVEQQAIEAATRDAYYKVDIVAKLLETQIYAVQSVTIGPIEWNNHPAQPPASLDNVHCTATVTVEYLHGPPQ